MVMWKLALIRYACLLIIESKRKLKGLNKFWKIIPDQVDPFLEWDLVYYFEKYIVFKF